MGGGCAATCCMSFLRHQRSIVRWEHLHRGRSVTLLRPRLLTVSMSRSRLFLSGLHSCIARLRFTSRFHLRSIGCNCKPIQNSSEEFSIGTTSIGTTGA